MRIVCVAPQLTGDYGTVVQGQEFEVDELIGSQLVRNGHARRADPPRIVYQTKVVTPESATVALEAPGVSPRPPFRDVPMLNPESPRVAPASDPLLSGPDVCKPGTPYRSGRRRREGFGSR